MNDNKNLFDPVIRPLDDSDISTNNNSIPEPIQEEIKQPEINEIPNAQTEINNEIVNNVAPIEQKTPAVNTTPIQQGDTFSNSVEYISENGNKSKSSGFSVAKFRKYASIFLFIMMIVSIFVIRYILKSRGTEELVCTQTEEGVDMEMSLYFRNGHFSSGKMVETVDISESTEVEKEALKNYDLCSILSGQINSTISINKCTSEIKSNKIIINMDLDVSLSAQAKVVDAKAGKEYFEKLGYKCNVK